MRSTASILHLDLDAFFAAVEQRDKPSLRGKPVIVGGTGQRGVVATASYEARAFGVRSAMSTREARSRCPHAAFLAGRFDAYAATSTVVMDLLRTHTPLVEPLSFDEAYVDLKEVLADFSPAALRRFATALGAELTEATGGLTASIGVASSKFLAKIASELRKPAGVTIIEPGTERDWLRPMAVTVIPGVGPATADRLRQAGVSTVHDLEQLSESELVRQVGKAHGQNLFQLARAEDSRHVEPERATKSVSVESTYETDLTDRVLIEGIIARQARQVAERLHAAQLSGRTITLKVRLADFTTLTRSATLGGPTDAAPVIARTALSLLADVNLLGGVRLLGCGVAGLADWIQEELWQTAEGEDSDAGVEPEVSEAGARSRDLTFPPGADVEHSEWGRGWVWGSGKGVVTVRFESYGTPPGPVKSLPLDDPNLRRVGADATPLSRPRP